MIKGDFFTGLFSAAWKAVWALSLWNCEAWAGIRSRAFSLSSVFKLMFQMVIAPTDYL